MAPCGIGSQSVLRDPGIIAAEVDKSSVNDGGLARDLGAVERHIVSLDEQQSRIAKRLTDIDDDDVAALMLAELKSALGAKVLAAETERDGLEERLIHRDAERERVSSLAEWCRTVELSISTVCQVRVRSG